MEQKRLSSTEIKYECGHCANVSKMLVLSKGNLDEDILETLESGNQFNITHYWIWHILRCPSCEKVNIYQEYWNSASDVASYDGITNTYDPYTTMERLYPQDKRIFKNLPQYVKESLRVARRLLHLEPLAAAVFVGRTIEYVCADRKAKGRSLEDKIKNLAAQNEIPPQLADMAQSSRLFRNMGAHASGIDSISVEDASVLCDFCEAILEYVYEAPVMMEHIKKRLGELKAQEDQWRVTQANEPPVPPLL